MQHARLFLAVLLAQILLPAQSLLVLSKHDLTLSIVDPASLKVIAKAPSGQDPHEVIASTDATRAYISNYGGGSLNTITVIDLVNQKALAPIDLGPLRGPHGLDFVGGKLWFTAEGAKVIGSYDPATAKIDWVFGTGQNRTHMLYVFPDLNRIITTNVSSATISLIEKTTGGPRVDWNQTLIPVGRGAEGFDLSPDRKEIWAANAQDGTVSIVDANAKKVLQTVDADVRGANRLKFTPDGKRVLVSTLGGPNLTVIDVSSRQVVKRIPIGKGAAGILMHPDGAKAYVACTPDDYVTVIDLHSLAVAGRFEAGGNPDGLAWAVRR